MLENVTATSGASVPRGEVPVVAALLLVQNGVSPTQLAARFATVCQAGQEPAGAAMLLRRLAELGLVRMTRQDREPHYVLTALGQQHAQATVVGQPELAGGLAAPEHLRTDLLSTEI